MQKPELQEHWYSYGDGCLAVEESNPPKSELKEVSSCTLLFLHGRFGQAEVWGPLLERVSWRFRCLNIDFPGFGRSFSVRECGYSLLEQAKLVRQVIQRFALKGQRLVLVGHDTGGAVAQLCALQETESVRGLVLINSAALTEPPSYFKTGFFSLRARLMLKHLSRLGSRKESPEHRLLMRDWANHARRASMVQAFHAWENTWPGPVERRRFREEVSKLRQPVLLLWGRRDPMSPFDHARELMRYLPDGYLFENEESGHWPCFEEPDWVELKIREFLFMLGATQSARRGA